MSDTPNGNVPRISVRKGIELFCHTCNDVVAFVESRVEAVAEEKAHKVWHRER